MWNRHPGKVVGGTEEEINNKKVNITRGIQKVLVDTSYYSAESMNDEDKVVFGDMLQKIGYHNNKSIKGRISGRDKHIKNNLSKDV